ncbi:MAG: coenzyme F420-0:L-glutamate ligase [Fimbriimonadales bacterium]|nr:coenzyme F420-0:L-glutamate ligase [Fimbriimonadales bacterium]
MECQPNPGKELYRTYQGRTWARCPIRTHVVMPSESLEHLLEQYVRPRVQAGDIVVLAEKVVAICQGRAYPVESIQPRPLAHWLSRFVTRTPAGIGIGSPVTMELALREAGIARILIAAAVAACTRPLGIRGLFYRIAGRRVAAIDGPTPYTLPPYNQYACLAPERPNAVCELLSERLGVPVAIVDANDLGVVVLGKSREVDSALIVALFADNPLGQGAQQTPICILRPVDLETA